MKRNRLLMVVLVVLTAWFDSAASARTWRVAADHSGDWWDLYTAVLAAGDGDTLSIAPGRYDYLVQGIYDGYGVIANWNEPKSITFIGDHRDSVFIGPASYDPEAPGIGPGYVGPPGVVQRFQSMTIENMRSAITVWSNIEACDLNIRNCTSIGIDLLWGTAGLVQDCTFTNIGNMAIRLAASDNYVIENCIFDSVFVYVESGSENFTIRRSTFSPLPHPPQDPTITIYLSGGRIEDCDLAGHLLLGDDHNVILSNNRFVIGGQDETCLRIPGNGTCTLDRNVLQGGTFAAISIAAADSDLSGSGNHILRLNGALAVSAYGWHNNSRVDLRGNYWGTASEDSVAAWIFDKYDDPEVYAEVLFSPIEPAPVPVEKKSLGGLKALFLGR